MVTLATAARIQLAHRTARSDRHSDNEQLCDITVVVRRQSVLPSSNIREDDARHTHRYAEIHDPTLISLTDIINTGVFGAFLARRGSSVK